MSDSLFPVLLLVFGLIGVAIKIHRADRAAERAADRAKIHAAKAVNIICPHCQTKGTVTTNIVKNVAGDRTFTERIAATATRLGSFDPPL